MELEPSLVNAYAYKGLNLHLLHNIVTATGFVSGVNVTIQFTSSSDAKIWFENQYNYSIIDASELFEENQGY